MADNRAKRDRFIEYFGLHSQVVFNTIYSKVGNKEDAEDLVQEVFIAFYNKLDEIENPRAWLLGSLKNTVLHFYRKREQGHQNIDDVMSDITLTFVNGFRDTRILIGEAIEAEIKNDDERTLIDLIAFNGYSYRAAAKIMGITKKTVEYRYNAIAKRILDNLRNRGIKNIEDLL